jgi:type II secretory pathway component GspD/PulD (secretin)
MILRKIVATLGALAALLISSGGARAQVSETPSAEDERGVPIEELISTVAKKTGKQFMVDPRVQARVTLIGQDIGKFGYSDLLAVLRMHGFAAFENSGYVNVMPDASARQWPVPIVTGRESPPDASVVTKIIAVKSISAAQLVPVLRPMIPQYGHLVAYPCTNRLIIVDTFANVKRIEKIVESVDVGGEPYKSSICSDQPPPKPGA